MTSLPPAVSAPDTPWMSPADVITYAKASRTEVFTALREGRLRGYQAAGKNGKWRVHRDDVDAWIRGDKPAPVAAPKITRRAG